jgi:hypothetical protein
MKMYVFIYLGKNSNIVYSGLSIIDKWLISCCCYHLHNFQIHRQIRNIQPILPSQLLRSLKILLNMFLIGPQPTSYRT